MLIRTRNVSSRLTAVIETGKMRAKKRRVDRTHSGYGPTPVSFRTVSQMPSRQVRDPLARRLSRPRLSGCFL